VVSKNTNNLVFLNKSDIMREKILTSPLSVCFPDYVGGPNFDKAVEFIRDKFLSTHLYPKEKPVYTHTTCATDTNNIKVVFDAVSEKVMLQMVANVGM